MQAILFSFLCFILIRAFANARRTLFTGYLMLKSTDWIIGVIEIPAGSVPPSGKGQSGITLFLIPTCSGSLLTSWHLS